MMMLRMLPRESFALQFGEHTEEGWLERERWNGLVDLRKGPEQIIVAPGGDEFGLATVFEGILGRKGAPMEAVIVSASPSVIERFRKYRGTAG